MATPPQKVSLYSVNELKNATDDAIAPYLTSLPKPYTFKQQHFATNVRLFLGYSAVTIAAILFYADYKLGWDTTKPYTLPACVAYFIINGLFTYWIWGVESGTVFAGVRDGGQKLTLKSLSQKYTPTYKLKIRYEAPSGKTFEDKEVEGYFTEWFNKDGFLQKREFQLWLGRNVEVIGLADPVSIQSGEKKYDEVVEDTVTVASSVETTGPKKGRPKKKI